MRGVTRVAALLVACALPTLAAAGDFSAGSEAKEWGLLGEEKARFTARVVDLTCEIAGDCPADCGGGRRQLGLVRAGDDVLVYPLKNGQAAFSGAASDLFPFCGQTVEVDGLLVGDEDQTPVKYYMVQRIRAAEAETWVKANRWTKDWANANPEAKKGKGPWFRKDPRVLAAIEKDGYLGLGPETDKAFIEYYFDE